MAEALKVNSTLTSLDIACDGKWTLKDCWRKGNKIGDDGCKEIGQALRVNSSIVSMNLRSILGLMEDRL